MHPRDLLSNDIRECQVLNSFLLMYVFICGVHAPHFYCLQLKYQFNTIKVMGRIFTVFLFIIIPFVKLFAAEDIAPCSNWSSDSSQCDSQPGCKYESGNAQMNEPDECKACDIDHFGEGCNSTCSDVTDGAFPFGHKHMGTCDGGLCAVRGARTKYECYKKLDKGPDDTDETGHGKKCKDESDHDIEYSADTSTGLKCRQYYRDDGKSYVSCDGTTTGTDSATGNVTDTNSDGNGYHMEGAQCYKNERKCRLFSSNCSVSSESHQEETDDSQQGNVQWVAYIDPNDNETKHKWKYNNSNCKCEIAGDLTEKSCNGTKYNPIRSMSNTETVNASISYLNPSSPDDSTVWAHYTCTGCLAGYYASGNTGGSFNCVAAPRGYYSTGCGTKWTAENPLLYSGPNSCGDYDYILKPCYAGMTTNDSGATSVHDCRYSTNTKFCDAWGCTNYLSLVEDDADDWWWYMRESTGSSGSGIDSSNDDIPIDVIPFD